MLIVDSLTAQSQLAELIETVLSDEEVLIARGGRGLVRLAPIAYRLGG